MSFFKYAFCEIYSPMGPTLTNIYDLVALSLYVPYTARGGGVNTISLYTILGLNPYRDNVYCTVPFITHDNFAVLHTVLAWQKA